MVDYTTGGDWEFSPNYEGNWACLPTKNLPVPHTETIFVAAHPPYNPVPYVPSNEEEYEVYVAPVNPERSIFVIANKESFDPPTSPLGIIFNSPGYFVEGNISVSLFADSVERRIYEDFENDIINESWADMGTDPYGLGGSYFSDNPPDPPNPE